MSKIKIGIMPRYEFQRRILDIAAGKINPKREESKIWFSSMKSLGEVLSDNNIRLLKLINEHPKKTLGELARLSGWHTSNFSRRLKTMEKYGFVELIKHAKKVQVITKVTEFDIQYAIR
jgi:predicted transcriptional regulator